MFPTANPSDVAVVQEVCNAVSNRAAKLAAAGKSSFYLAWLSLLIARLDSEPIRRRICVT